MGDDRTQSPIEALRQVLHAEREALRFGALMELEALCRAKEKLASEIEFDRSRQKHPDMTQLRALARTNADLLDAARRGVRSAMDRVAERARVAAQLDTYDAAGQRRSFAAPESSTPRRA